MMGTIITSRMKTKTNATIAFILHSRHHICLLSCLALLLNAVALSDKLSDLSCSSSNLSPRSITLVIFSCMTSMTSSTWFCTCLILSFLGPNLGAEGPLKKKSSSSSESSSRRFLLSLFMDPVTSSSWRCRLNFGGMACEETYGAVRRRSSRCLIIRVQGRSPGVVACPCGSGI